VVWVEWVEWVAWECKTHFKEQVSKKTRRINTFGLFFCSLCGDELDDKFNNESNFKI